MGEQPEETPWRWEERGRGRVRGSERKRDMAWAEGEQLWLL